MSIQDINRAYSQLLKRYIRFMSKTNTNRSQTIANIQDTTVSGFRSLHATQIPKLIGLSNSYRIGNPSNNTVVGP